MNVSTVDPSRPVSYSPYDYSVRPGAIMVRDTTAPLDPDNDLYPIFDHVRELGEKDLSLALELADELAVETPLARLSLERLAAALGLGEKERDGDG